MADRKTQDKMRRHFYKKKYGITVDTYEDMLLACDARCEICGVPATEHKEKTNRYLSVDHDHNTGKVRGLLCSNCNLMIGNANDDPKVLLRGAQYLMEKV